MLKKILIIDDEINILRSLEMILKGEGFVVKKAANLKTAKSLIEKEQFSFFLLDVMLPDGDGIEFIKHIRKFSNSAVIIMISGHATVKMAVDATQKGADDFLEKPLSKDKVIITLKNFIKRLEIEEKYSELQDKHSNLIIGKSKAISGILDQVEKVAPSNSKVLITGESGTGKEIIAQLIHQKSQRKNNPYIKINCAAIPADLIESELFGAEKGAFTGAVERREGKFSQANTGTLFLDEIADMSLDTQTKVLRILQEGEFQRVGGQETLTTDVRIIAATNKELTEMVKKNTFREDLYFRLHVVPIHVPPLRERKEDIPLLADYFLNNFSHENNKPKLIIEKEVIEKLISYNWPGNIRELKNLIERMVIMVDGNRIEVNQLPADFMIQDFMSNDTIHKQQSLRAFREQSEVQYLQYLIKQTSGNIAEIAEILKVDRTYLYKKLKKLGLRE